MCLLSSLNLWLNSITCKCFRIDHYFVLSDLWLSSVNTIANLIVLMNLEKEWR